jgi:hypothetical protein
MRVLVDPDTGEMVEVLESDTVGVGAYDLPQGRRAVMAQTREKREALTAHAAAVQAKAEAESWYRQCLAAAVLIAKDEHGATVAEAVAKGTTEVAEAREKMLAAEGLERNAQERLRLCSEDRASIHRLIEWSAQQERFAGGGEPE